VTVKLAEVPSNVKPQWLRGFPWTAQMAPKPSAIPYGIRTLVLIEGDPGTDLNQVITPLASWKLTEITHVPLNPFPATVTLVPAGPEVG
jgi:hypothetical protein